MRGLRSTLVLLAILLGLGAYIYFVESDRPTSEEAATAKDSVFELEAEQIEGLRVTASGETSVLEKQDGAWRLLEPVDAGVAEMEVDAIANALASLQIERVLEEQPTDVTPFGLSEPRIDIGFRQAGEETMRHLRLGDKTATGGDLYAQISDDPRVFLIAGYLEGTFDRSPFELRDKSILEFDRDAVERVEVVRGAETLRATKRDDRWLLEAPARGRADSPAFESLLTRLQTVQMKSIVAEGGAPIDLAALGLDPSPTRVTVGAGSTHASLAFGTTSDAGDRYARDEARGVVFTVDPSLFDDVSKPANDYRRKDMFDFRSWNATTLAVTRDGVTRRFEKRTAEDGQSAGWHGVEPASDLDEGRMQTFLTKLSGLRAEDFAETRAGTGLDTPALTVDVEFDDGAKHERVLFGRTITGVFALTGDDDPPATIDATAYQDVVSALDDVLEPQ